MPHPGQAFLKNAAKRKRECEIYSKNRRENIKRLKQSANSSTYTRHPCRWINRRSCRMRRNLQGNKGKIFSIGKVKLSINDLFY